MRSTFGDAALFWRSPLLPDTELLTAQDFTHEFAPHWHEGFVIPVIQSGALGYHYRGARCVAASGSIAAINPGEINSGERAVDKGCAYRAFYPSLAWMQQLASDMAGRAVGVPWLPDAAIEDGEVAAQLGRAHRMLEAGTDALAVQTALTGAFALLLARHAQNGRPPAPVHADAVRVERMKAALSEALAEPLTLTHLAARVGLSPFHAARLFSRAVGMPPHAWRNQLRLNRARGLLRQGVALAQVAAATGFVDQSHFSRHFKRAYGVAPGRWRP